MARVWAKAPKKKKKKYIYIYIYTTKGIEGVRGVSGILT